jgi:azobenzene reductase
MRILLVCGSIAEKSHTNALLRYIQKLFEDKNTEVEFWDLKKKSIPICLPKYHKDPTKNPSREVRDFVSEVELADLIILGSPLYHGSFSGVLKNALDNLRWDAFRGKWIGLVGNAGGPRAIHTQVTHLRQVVNTLAGYCAQTQITTSGVDYVENEENYEIEDVSIKDRCMRLVDELINAVKVKA